MNNNTKQPEADSESELRAKLRRVFSYRTHKLPIGKAEIITKEDMAKYRTIIAPYEPTIDKLVRFIAARDQARDAQKLAEIEARRPEKMKQLDAQYDDTRAYAFVSGQHEAIDQYDTVVRDVLGFKGKDGV